MIIIMVHEISLQ